MPASGAWCLRSMDGEKNYFCHFPNFHKGYNYSPPYFHLKYKKAKKSVLKKSEKTSPSYIVHTVLYIYPFITDVNTNFLIINIFLGELRY